MLLHQCGPPLVHAGPYLSLGWLQSGANLDLDAGLLRIGRSVRHLKGGFVFSEPKTKRGRRTVELSTPTVA